eukprot:CAMPEP_0197700558 /NCGR_PEP_ID=MMETSP1338-20131121/122130_1 /TAXON_ID=43686 ORGANISM="Pelagodinium beii, Strain RCC1491" /NCGR_SAMPLE_ID=MMETSP1338 /ASSEMBLY_ACC=CAM_ASM_000754 /LENGTH=136 /DNA_ID=CAMNT_0043284189 /DNA_START=562 /DNA_END=972 /DNA_ORIENTATION=+
MARKTFEDLVAKIELLGQLVHPRLLQELQNLYVAWQSKLLVRQQCSNALVPSVSDGDEAAWAIQSCRVKLEALGKSLEALDLPAIWLCHSKRLEDGACTDHRDVFKNTENRRHESGGCVIDPTKTRVGDYNHLSEL